MKTHDHVFAQRPYLLASQILSYGSTNIGFSPYGEYRRQFRKICTTELLSSKRVETFRGIREEEVMNFVRDISSNTGSAINLSKRIFSHTYGVTGRAAFGKKNRDQEEFMEAKDELVALFGGFSVADMYPSVKLLQVMSGMRRKLEKLHKRVDQILENFVNEHREKKTERESGRGEAEDLVDVLLRVQKDGELEFPLTDDNIKAVIL
ncbi:cytochrome P450 71D8-like, partial [Camellia sinensis]|uniref:cytochrome P450 71D8-like n=1 Tax=Camellia sinensis TaxID=4442 RepID=UPI001035FA04